MEKGKNKIICDEHYRIGPGSEDSATIISKLRKVDLVISCFLSSTGLLVLALSLLLMCVNS